MIQNIPEGVDSKFRLVLLIARRAEQLIRGARPKIKTELVDATDVHFTRSRLGRCEHAAHVLMRCNDQADAAGNVASQRSGLRPFGLCHHRYG